MRLTATVTTLAIALAGAAPAAADHRRVAADVADGDDDGDGDAAAKPLIVVNATQELRDVGQVKRLHRALDARHMLLPLPEDLEATLDGRNVLTSNLAVIRDAYANADFEAALRLIVEDKRRLLELAAGDLALALTELCQWHGIVAAANDDLDEALRQFQAAHRLNPAWRIDRKLAPPRVRAIAAKARRDPDARGALRLDTDAEGARIAIDGGEPRPADRKLRLPVGLHLVVVTAPRRTPHAELVDVRAGKITRIEVELAPETRLTRAARLVDATAAAPAGRQRLQRAGSLTKLTGADRFLFIEGGGDDHVMVRVYDLGLRKVSRSLRLDSGDSSAAIAREVKAALDPDRFLDVDTALRATATRSPRWYERWYVWAGIAAVAGGSYLGYQYLSREPTTLRGL